MMRHPHPTNRGLEMAAVNQPFKAFLTGINFSSDGEKSLAAMSGMLNIGGVCDDV